MVVNHTINLLAEGKTSYTDGGIFAEFAWIIVVLPFIAALVNNIFWKKFAIKGCRDCIRFSIFYIPI